MKCANFVYFIWNHKGFLPKKCLKSALECIASTSVCELNLANVTASIGLVRLFRGRGVHLLPVHPSRSAPDNDILRIT